MYFAEIWSQVVPSHPGPNPPGLVSLGCMGTNDWIGQTRSALSRPSFSGKKHEKTMGPRFGHTFLWACHNLAHETFLELHMIGSVHSYANLQGPHQTPKLLPRRYGTCSCGWEAHGSLQAFLKHLLAWVICWM